MKITSQPAIDALAAKVAAGNATVNGTTRDELGTQYLIVHDNEIADVRHVLIPWQAVEADRLFAQFGYSE
jgi:hypothetical protein